MPIPLRSTEKDYLKPIASYLKNTEKLDPVPTGVKAQYSKDASIKAVVFDIYGTLLISSSGDVDEATMSTRNLEEALRTGNFIVKNSVKNKEDILTRLLYEFKINILKHQANLRSSGFNHPEVDIFGVWKEVIENAADKKEVVIQSNSSLKTCIFVFELLSNKVFPMPGMKKTIKGLQEKNIPLGIVSNAQFYTPVIMNYFLHDSIKESRIIPPFEESISLFSFIEMRAKPDVTLFNKLMLSMRNKYRIKPDEVLFVGNDMLKDIYTARKGGLKTALFAGDKRSLRWRDKDKRVEGLKPDHIVDRLEQILDIVA